MISANIVMAVNALGWVRRSNSWKLRCCEKESFLLAGEALGFGR